MVIELLKTNSKKALIGRSRMAPNRKSQGKNEDQNNKEKNIQLNLKKIKKKEKN